MPSPVMRVRVPEDRLASWEAAASDADLSLPEWVRRSLDQVAGTADDTPGRSDEPPPSSAPDGEMSDARGTSPRAAGSASAPGAQPPPCPHPKKDRDPKGYMTLCKACGERVR